MVNDLWSEENLIDFDKSSVIFFDVFVKFFFFFLNMTISLNSLVIAKLN